MNGEYKAEPVSLSVADKAALDLIDIYNASLLDRIRQSAQRWTAGLAGIISLLSTAFVIKGPDTIAKVANEKVRFTIFDTDTRSLVVYGMILGILLLVLGILCANQAANGSFMGGRMGRLAAQRDAIASDEASAKWRDAHTHDRNHAACYLATAVWATVLGFACLGGMMAVSALNVADGDKNSYYCIISGNGTTKLDGAPSKVVGGELRVVPCP